MDYSIEPVYKELPLEMKEKMTDHSNHTAEEAALDYFKRKMGLKDKQSIFKYFETNKAQGISIAFLKMLKT